MGFLHIFFYFCRATLDFFEYKSCKDNIESYCTYIFAEQGPKYIRKFLFPFFHPHCQSSHLVGFLASSSPLLWFHSSFYHFPQAFSFFSVHLYSSPCSCASSTTFQNTPESSLHRPLNSQCPNPFIHSFYLLQHCQFSFHCRIERIDDFGFIQCSRKLHVDYKHWPEMRNIDV